MNFLTANVAVVVDDSKLPAQLARIKTAVTKTVGKIKASFRRMGVAFKSVFTKMVRVAKWAAVGIVASFALTIRAAMKQEDAIHLLNAALKISGEFTEELSKQFQDFAAEIQQVTIYGDEFVLSLMQQQSSLGITADRLEETTKLTIGLAVATNRSVEAMVQYVARALEGDFTMLQRYIPALKLATSATEKMAIVTDRGSRGFLLAMERARTTSGRLIQTMNALGDAVLEAIGKPFLKHIKNAADAVKKWAKENEERISRWAEVWAEKLNFVMNKIWDWVILLKTEPRKALIALGKELLIFFSAVADTFIVLGMSLGKTLVKSMSPFSGPKYKEILAEYKKLGGMIAVTTIEGWERVVTPKRLHPGPMPGLPRREVVWAAPDKWKAATQAARINQIKEEIGVVDLLGQIWLDAGEKMAIAITPRDPVDTLDSLLEQLKTAVDGLDERLKSQVDTIVKTKEETKELVGVMKVFDEWIKSSIDWGKNLGNVLTDTFDNASDALADFVLKGKADFASLANSFVSDMTRMIIKAEMAQALGMFIPGLSGGSGAYGGRGLLGGLFPVGEKVASAQSGGVVEKTGLAKIHKGEEFSGVGRKLGGGTVTINVNAIDAAGTYQFLNTNKRTIATMLEGTINSNHSLRRSKSWKS